MLIGVCLFFSFRGVSSTEFGDLETMCKAVVKEKQPFERLEISKETLLKMFKVSPPCHSTHLSCNSHEQLLTLYSCS